MDMTDLYQGTLDKVRGFSSMSAQLLHVNHKLTEVQRSLEHMQ